MKLEDFDLDNHLSDEAKNAERELGKADRKQLNAIVSEINAQNERKSKEIDAEKRRMRDAINNCNNENEKAALMQQLEAFEKQMQQQVRDESTQQDAKLQAALEARRKRRGQFN